MPTIHAIIVTYNRRQLLERCLLAIGAQTRAPDAVTVVDNASTDGTFGWLANWLPEYIPNGTVLPLPENSGGAGGFAAGMESAFEAGSDWVWMMDDDAEPQRDALAELLKVATDPNNTYGSLAVNGTDTSWLTTLVKPVRRVVEKANEVPNVANVQSLPFLGFMIHRDLVAKIGLPDIDYFIAADDIEYCLRAQRSGAEIIIAGNSRIEHPKSRPYAVKLPGRTLIALELPPWKRYYDTRNRLLIARKYYGIKLLTHTIPGSFIRMFASLVKEKHKWAQAHAFFAGLIDGTFGIKGKRHEKWGIRQ